MNEIKIGNPDAIWWLLVALGVLTCGLIASMLSARAKRKFATPSMRPRVFASLRQSTLARTVIMSAAVIGLLSASLMDLRWGKIQQEVPQKGIEVVFLLDVSRSMLASDATPNRLTRAKQQIKDMIDAMAGDRIGLVVFAGETRQMVPMTNHYDDFRQVLRDVDPSSVRLGGSKLGAALETAGDAFLTKTNSNKALVVFTDGEDQESEPVTIAKRLSEESGVQIYTVGLGDMDQGARVPDFDPDRPERQPGRYVRYQGEPVWSKMNGQILAEVATATGGAYVPAGTKQVDMKALYQRFIASMPQTEFGVATIDAYQVRFHWFAVPAFLLLLVDLWLGSRTIRKVPKPFAAAALLGLLVVQPNIAQAQDVQASPITLRETMSQGSQAFADADYAKAADLFGQGIAATDDEIALKARYNLGTTLYAACLGAAEQSGEDAIKLAEKSIGALRSALRIDSNYQDARYNLQRAVQLLESLRESQQQQPDESQQPAEDGEQEQSQDKNQEASDQEDGEQQSEENQQAEQDKQDQSSQQTGNESEDSSQSQRTENSADTENQQPGEDGSESQSKSSQPMNDGNSSEQDKQATDEQEENETSDENDASNDNQSHRGELSARKNDSSQQQTAAQGEDETESTDETTAWMTKEEAMKMLQAVRDRDMIRRFRKQAKERERSRQIRVDKDW